MLSRQCDDPFSSKSIKTDVVWPTLHAKQILYNLVNDGFHKFQHTQRIVRIDAHEVLVQFSLTYPAQSVSSYILIDTSFQADVQYPPQFLNEWENAPPLRSVYGDSDHPDIKTSSKYKGGSFRHTMVHLSHVPPSSQESSDTNKTATSIRSQFKKATQAVVTAWVSTLS